MQIFVGTASKALGAAIGEYLGMKPSRIMIDRFPDTETTVKVESDVRGSDVFVVQSTCAPVNENLMELLIVLDCLKRASAARITAVVPYYGYARQDRKDEGRVPITAKLAANLITTAGANRVLTMDLHAAQIQGFFDIPLDHLFAAPVLNRYLIEKHIPDVVIASPDVGSIKLARAYAERLGAGLAVIDKKRVSGSEVEVGYVIGDVTGKNVVLVDDLIATAGSICSGCLLLKEHGAKDVYVLATHPVFCGQAFERITRTPFREVVVTDTIPLGKEWVDNGVKVLSVAPILGEAMKRIHRNESVSSLFDKAFDSH
jgi:ribose-phosphate pyrophosphokinase